MKDRYHFFRDKFPPLFQRFTHLKGPELSQEDWGKILEKIDDQLHIEFGDWLGIINKETQRLLDFVSNWGKEIKDSKKRIEELERLVSFQQKQIEWLTKIREEKMVS